MLRRHNLNFLRSVVAFAFAICVCSSALGVDRAVEDVRGFRRDGVISAEVALGCGMRYLDHSPRGGGIELRVRLALSPDCQRAIGGVRNELYRPRGGYMGAFDEVEFESAGLGEATVIVRFQRPVSFEVSQGALLNLLEIQVDTDTNVWVKPKQKTAPPTSSSPQVVMVPPASPVPVPVTEPREPLQLVKDDLRDDAYRFVINLATVRPDYAADLSSLAEFADRIVYKNDIRVGDHTWNELRMGFFTSEDEARSILEKIKGEYPRAWISVADAEERARAVNDPLFAPVTGLPPANVTAMPAGESTDPAQIISPERSAELMAEAKSAMIDRNYDRSVQIYTRVLEDSQSTQRRGAREFLGLAREKKGQVAHAKAEYEAYLSEYPDGPDAARVRQRLAGLGDTVPTTRRIVREENRPERAEWDFYGSASQYYYRDVNKPRQDEADFVSQSALLSQTDMVIQRRGERIDLLGRVNAGYYFDMLGEPEGPGDQALVSFAYLDITDQDSNLNARIGRQTSYSRGVLGRFDGVHLSYGWRPNLTVNVTTGFSVDSPRHELETGRFFYGASIDLNNIAEAWDFSVFTNQQQIDGISDREAVGAEAQFHSERWNLVGMADYDLSYNVLNSALFIGNWRANDRLTLNTRFNAGASPYLTTRNALIGQPVTTIDALLETFSEGQIRRLARNRTAQTQTASIGFSAALSERFNLNTDVTHSEIEATPESGGIPATPGTGGQIYYTANLVGSSLFKARDTSIVGVRYTSSDIATISTLIFDLRYPIGDDLRINPRVAVSSREGVLDNSDQLIIAPTLRLIYRWFRRSRLEFELGGQWSDRELPANPLLTPVVDQTEESSAYYLSLGYYMDF